MGTYKDSFIELVNGYKEEGLLDYEIFDFRAKKFTENAQSRIYHFSLKKEASHNKDAIVMVFTIGNNVGRTVIQSEGPKTENASSTYPQKKEAVRLAQENKWKYLAIGISSKDFQNELIRDYVVSVESTDYAKETVCVLDDSIQYLEANNRPSFYRCTQKVNNVEYTLSFIKKDIFLEYIKIYDNRPEVERYGELKSDIEKYDVLDHNLYGIHIKEQNDALSADNSHICIGWSVLGDLSTITTKDELRSRYVSILPNSPAKSQGQNVGQIWRFINEMQIGDYVVFAEKNILHIGRVVSNYYYDDTQRETQSADYTNNRNVIWIKTDIQRSEISQALHRALMTGMSIWTMNDYRSAIADLLMGTYVKDESLDDLELCYNTSIVSSKPRNRILFGAPGTGKSFTLNKECAELIGEDNEVDYERVTFHPDYSYANFVGTYKPVPINDGNSITYKYVPGPFMRAYVKALKNGCVDPVRPFLLIIEEINRANVAAVFGDVFQLLDRDDDGVSEYAIQASEDMKTYLADELGGVPDDYGKIKLPNNLFIWATMNSADQGVFPMDTAFKRRWDFTYLGIDDNDKEIRGKYVMLGAAGQQKVEWNKLRKAINRSLAKLGINEDKQLGPYFISRSIVVPAEGNEIDREGFINTFKNKVIMYLFEDAARQKRSKLFSGENARYSEICNEFDNKGINIFCPDIQNEVLPEDGTPISPDDDN